jgi:hypothetical protein
MGNTYGILAMALAVVVFIASDALAKFVGATLPSAQTIGVYSPLRHPLAGAGAAASGAWRQCAASPTGTWRCSILGCVGIYTYLVALFHIPSAWRRR